MTFTQETFLGASIRNFSAQVGWGGQPSTLDIGLVDDISHGDSFNPPVVGHPVYFNYKGWKFGGLLQSSMTQYGEGGNPLYSVKVQDPRELLSGVQLILQDYTGYTYGVPNLYNIYGYLESTGFGNSQSNDSGIPWMLVRNAFASLQVTNPILFRGHTFRFSPFVGVALSLPSYFRIGGDSISALDFVQNICDAIACDFFITLDYYSNIGNMISLNLVNRSIPPVLGAIDTFVTNVNGAVSKEQGFELANTVVNKFVVGGKMDTLYFQYNNIGNPRTPYDDTILPYWGYDAADQLIVGRGNFVTPGGDGSEYQFTIDGRPIYIQTGIPSTIFYKTDLAEMRAAKDSQDSWQAFIAFKSGQSDSIHKDKMDIFQLAGGINNNIHKELDAIIADPTKPLPVRTVSRSVGKKFNLMSGNFNADTIKLKVDKIYEHIYKYATEFYGKKFMVRVPFVVGKQVSETMNSIILSHKPVDAGYAEESTWAGMTQQGLMPYNVEKLTTEDNRIVCYVRFSNMRGLSGTGVDSGLKTKYNLTNLSTEEYILDQYPNVALGKMRENLFVKAKVEENYVFPNKYSLLNPRAVITLSGPIADNDLDSLTMSKGLTNELALYLTNGGVSQEVIDKYIAGLHTQWGCETLWFGKEAMFYAPDLAVIPLESNVLRYGPWHNYTTRSGKVEYETDDTLVPWTYGSYTMMNYAGNAKVSEASIGQDIGEKGSVTFPGIPSIQLGHALVDSGPSVTDISVNVSQEGVTTTYSMNTWTQRFGNIGKYNFERIQKISKLAQEQRKRFRTLFGYRASVRIPGPESGSERLDSKKMRADRGSSSATFLGGDIIISGEGESLEVKTSVAAVAGYRIASQVDEVSYLTKTAISLDGIFVPYTTNPDNTDKLPHFETPVSDAKSPTSEDLNPFGEKGIALAFPDGDLPEDVCTEYDGYEDYVKGVGLKAPIIVGGWGYDIDDKPVPSAAEQETPGSATEFFDNVKNRADKWKVGPLDIRWDNDRKVWCSPPASSTTPPEDPANPLYYSSYLGKVYYTIPPMSSGHAKRHTDGWHDNMLDLDDIFNPHEIELPTDLKIKYQRYKHWAGLIAEPFQFVECSGEETPGGTPY